MNKINLKALSKEQTGSVAVAYLMKNPSEIPAPVRSLFKKMFEYDDGMRGVVMALKEAQKTIAELQPKSEQLYGSISTLTEVIVDMLSEDEIMEYANKYELPDGGPKATTQVATPQNVPVSDAPKDIDMAGSTSKQYNNENPVNLDPSKQTP